MRPLYLSFAALTLVGLESLQTSADLKEFEEREQDECVSSTSDFCEPVGDGVENDTISSEGTWFGGWLRWCPTSMSLLRAAEKRLFSYLKTPFTGKYVEIGPVVGGQDNKIWTITVNENSTKTPLVLLHGFASGVGLWVLNLKAFASQRPVYAIDLLGFGRSSRPNFSRDGLAAEDELVQSIEAWRQKMGLKKFILLGHSMGGFLASSYALKHPERISHLILADPWGFPERPVDLATRYQIPFWVKGIAFLIQPFNPLWILRVAGPWGPGLVQRARPDIIKKFSVVIDDAHEVIPTYIYHCNAQTPSGESAFHAMMSNFGWAKFPMVHRIENLKPSVPITFLYGGRSWIERSPGEQIQKTRKQNGSFVDVHVIPQAGHHVYADRYDVFNHLVCSACDIADQAGLPVPEGTNVDPFDEKSVFEKEEAEKKAETHTALGQAVLGKLEAMEAVP